jgi:hypothetical protein
VFHVAQADFIPVGLPLAGAIDFFKIAALPGPEPDIHHPLPQSPVLNLSQAGEEIFKAVPLALSHALFLLSQKNYPILWARSSEYKKKGNGKVFLGVLGLTCEIVNISRVGLRGE